MLSMATSLSASTMNWIRLPLYVETEVSLKISDSVLPFTPLYTFSVAPSATIRTVYHVSSSESAVVSTSSCVQLDPL